LDYFKFKNGLEYELKRIKHIVQTYNKISDNNFLSTGVSFFFFLPASFSSYIIEECKNSNQNSIKYKKNLPKILKNLE
jgi:hypothetical protein